MTPMFRLKLGLLALLPWLMLCVWIGLRFDEFRPLFCMAVSPW